MKRPQLMSNSTATDQVRRMNSRPPYSWPKLTCDLIWRREGRYIGRDDFERYCAGFQPDLPSANQGLFGDPRFLQIDHLLDLIRLQYNCTQLGFQLAVVKLVFVSHDRNVQSKTWDLLDISDWTEVQDLLKASVAGDRVKIYLQLGLLSQEAQTPLKSKTPPPGLEGLLNDQGPGTKLALPSSQIPWPQGTITSPYKPFGYLVTHRHLPRYFDGYNIATSEGLRRWQVSVLNDLQLGLFEDSAGRAQRDTSDGFSDVQQSMLSDARRDGEIAAMAETNFGDDADPIDTKERETREYFQVQGAFAAGHSQVGPPIEPSARATRMTKVLTDDGSEMYKCNFLNDMTDRKLHPFQVTGGVQMLLQTFGKVPQPLGLETQMTDEDERELKTLPTYCGILADQNGFGKTITTLFFISWLIKCHQETERVYKPICMIVPPNLLRHWATEIIQHWQGLRLVISHGGAKHDVKDALLDRYRIPLDFFGLLPAPSRQEKFPWLHNQRNILNRNTVWLTTYKAHAERFLVKVDGKWQSRAPDFFDVFIVDEVHNIRNQGRKTHAAVACMNAKYRWGITSTPNINQSWDIASILCLLFKTAKGVLEKDSTHGQWAGSIGTDRLKVLQILKTLPRDDLRQLAALDPVTITQLFKTKDNNRIRELYPLMGHRIVIRRGNESAIPRTKNGEFLLIRDLFKPYVIDTVRLEQTPIEKLSYQWFHLSFAHQFLEKCWTGLSTLGVSDIGKSTTAAKSQPFSYPLQAIRNFGNALASPLLARFMQILSEMGTDAVEAWATQAKANNFDAEDFARFVHRPGDPTFHTRREIILFLLQYSTILRYIYWNINKYVLNGEKLIILDNDPENLWFWVMMCQLLMVGTRSLHPGQKLPERGKILDEFNNPESETKILVSPYDGLEGVDLSKCCHRVIATLPAISAGRAMQAYGRVIKISQLEPVTITNAYVPNTFSQWAEARQVDKVHLESATKADSPEMQDALVMLLNRYQVKVNAVHEARDRKEERGSSNQDPNTDESNDNAASHLADGYHSEDSNAEEDSSNESNNPSKVQQFVDQLFSVKNPGQWVNMLRKWVQAVESESDRELQTMLNMRRNVRYTLRDLEQQDVMDCALRLLYTAKQGHMTLVDGAPIHIDYDLLPKEYVKAMRAKCGLTSREARYIRRKITELSERKAEPEAPKKRKQREASPKSRNVRPRVARESS